MSKIIKGTVVGDGSITIKRILKRCKELGVDYIGRIRKNIKIEVFGKEVKIENMFKKDFNKNKTKLRTINGKKFRISEKVVNISDVGKVKIVAVLMKGKKKIKYLVSTNYKKKAEDIINEYLKRCKIEESNEKPTVFRNSPVITGESIEGISRFWRLKEIIYPQKVGI
ncbi:hypothetical protein ACPB8Q_02800 [Methanocaldococcus indicus]|uniref:hypothetical protein n=1 Tax=Methanocaldococcus indicus TaxID=213231 RepID=UPI003C6DAA36